jgi:hypothetical protein
VLSEAITSVHQIRHGANDIDREKNQTKGKKMQSSRRKFFIITGERHKKSLASRPTTEIVSIAVPHR